MVRYLQFRRKAAIIILIAAFVAYFCSEAVLRQFVLHRAGTQSISLDHVLSRLPERIRAAARKKITIAELKDALSSATDDGQIINLSIALAREYGKQELAAKYAEIIRKYPKAPEALPAFTYYLMVSPGSPNSVSLDRYHKFLAILDEPDRFFAWGSGLTKIKSVSENPRDQLNYLLPLLQQQPKYREYQMFYLALTELAFQEDETDIEQRARVLDEKCEQLPYYDKRNAPKVTKPAPKASTKAKSGKKVDN